MASVFPSEAWVSNFFSDINNDEKYAQVGKKWEGSLVFEIKPDDVLPETVLIYLDLWHGKCREAKIIKSFDEVKTDFTLSAPFGNFGKILLGQLDPMQAMITRKLNVSGNMGYIMRNVPEVLDFVRCAKNSTSEILGI